MANASSLQMPSLVEPRAPLALAPCAAASARASTAFELISDRAAFEALESEWNALFARAGQPAQVFQTFNWNWHWCNRYLGCAEGGVPGVKLSIVIGRRDGKLVMIWPMVSERVRGITQIFWMGEPLSQYGDVIVDDLPDRMDVLRAGWRFLRSHARGDLLRLRRVRDDAVIAPLIEEIGALPSNTLTAPYLDLASAKDFAAYEQRYSGKARKNRRRLLRRLEELGPVAFERLRGGPRARHLALQAVALKNAWLKDRGLVSSAIGDNRVRRFFADVAEASSHPVDCVVSALTSNGQLAALEVSFACKQRLAMHLIVFNLKFEKSGAGALLMEQGLRDAYGEGFSTIDMLAPGDNYKLDWADGAISVTDWCQPLSLAGYTYAKFYLGFMRERLKSTLAGMPQPLRRLLSGGTRAT